MRLFIIAAFGLLALMGCLATTPYSSQPASPQQPAPQSQQPPANITENQTPTCGEYCLSQPHIECVGEWNISGTYPLCNCAFVCSIETPPENKTNETPPAEPPKPPATPPPIIQINKTANQLLEEGMAKLKGDYYAGSTGLVREKSYTWARVPANSTSDGIPLGVSAPATDLDFSGETIPGIMASGFIVFEHEDGTEVYGLAIAKGSTTVLDGYSEGRNFYVSYAPYPIKKEIWGCHISSKEHYTNAQGEAMAEYFFRCDGVDDI